MQTQHTVVMYRELGRAACKFGPFENRSEAERCMTECAKRPDCFGSVIHTTTIELDESE